MANTGWLSMDLDVEASVAWRALIAALLGSAHQLGTRAARTRDRHPYLQVFRKRMNNNVSRVRRGEWQGFSLTSASSAALRTGVAGCWTAEAFTPDTTGHKQRSLTS